MTNVHIKFWIRLFGAGWQESMVKAALEKIATTPAVPEENDELADLEIEEAEEEAHENDETVEG